MFDYSADVYECPICGLKHRQEIFENPCPRCLWIISGVEDEDENEYDCVNHCTMQEAKERYRNGLDIFGDPLTEDKVVLGTCYICHMEFNIFKDYCPRCGWFWVGNEEESKVDEYEKHNKMTIKQAKERYANGLRVIGGPLPKVMPRIIINRDAKKVLYFENKEIKKVPIRKVVVDKCYICGTEFNTEEDNCPYCDWFYSGVEHKLPPDEENPYNGMSVNEAKEKYSKGLNIWGNPLPKVKINRMRFSKKE